MKILVKSLFKTNRLTKKINGNVIFKVMQSKLKQNPESREFILDMNGIAFVNQNTFLAIKKMMQSSFEGNFFLKLENASPLTIRAFNFVFNPQKIN